MGVVARVIEVAVGIASVPLTISYLGIDRYGAWITIVSTMAFLNFTDFGLAHSLTNALVKADAAAERHLGRSYVSSALFMLSVIAFVLLAVAILLAPRLADFLFPSLQTPDAHFEIEVAVGLALALFALNLPFLVVERILAAHQESMLGHFWHIAGSMANLSALLAVIWFRGGLVWLVLGCFGLRWLASLASAVWLFTSQKPWLRPTFSGIDLGLARTLFSDGWKFFVINIGWMVNSQTDNMVIARYLGPAKVTPYAVTFTLFMAATLLQTIAYPSLWPAYTEAYARQDYGWIRRTLRSNFKFSFWTSLAVILFLVIFGSKIVRLWAGEAAVPPFSVILWMGTWRLMLSTLLVGSCLLNATGHLKGMTIYGSATAILNLVFSVLLVKPFGIAGVIAGTVLAFALANYLPTFLEVGAILRRIRTAKEMPLGQPSAAGSQGASSR